MRSWFFLAIVFLLSACVASDESKRMEAALEQGALLYGQGENDTLVFVPELDHAAGYFAGKKQYGKAAHAALYNGYAQVACKDKPAAMQSFKEAEHYGDLANDSLTVAWAQYEAGRLLFSEVRTEEASSVLRKSDENFGSDLTGRSLTNNMKACCFLVKHEYDSAIVYLEKSLDFAELGKSDLAKRKALNNLVVLHSLTGDYPKAFDALNRIRTEVSSLDTLLLYLNIANLHLTSGSLDSANYYFHRLETMVSEVSARNETKVSVYEALSRFAEKQENYQTALVYRKLHEDLMYRIQLTMEKNNVYRIQQQYDFESIQNQMKVKSARLQRNIVLLVLMLLFLAVVVVFILIRSRQKDLQMKQELDSLKQSLVKSVDATIIDEELSWHLRLMLKAVRLKKNDQSTTSKQITMEGYVMGGKDNLFDGSMVVIEKTYPNLFSIICERYPDLTETESKVCLLSCANLSNTEIAEILELSVNTINKSRSQIYRKLEVDSSSLKVLFRKISSTNK